MQTVFETGISIRFPSIEGHTFPFLLLTLKTTVNLTLHTMKNTVLFFILAVTVYATALAADNVLHNKFLNRLHAIADTSDCVVGVAIKDLKSGEEFLINENEIFPQASSIKIHILAELYRQAATKKISLSDMKTLPPSMKVGGGGILSELGDNTVSMSLRDYAVCMMVVSDNAATNLLIDVVGMNNVNASLQSLGATQTKLQRVMMDTKASAAGRENISTSHEAIVVLEKLYNGTLVNKQACDDIILIMSKENKTPLHNGVPSTVKVADKGGKLDGVRCGVGIVYLENNPYIICVMTKLLMNDEDGSRIISLISRLAYNYFERKANSNEFGRKIPK